MSTFLNREVHFSQISNYALRDKNLSRKAKGLYAEIYSYITIPNFKLSKSYLMKTGPEGETAFNSMWKELKEKGYLKQYRISVNNNGTMSFVYKYDLLDKPDLKTPYLTNVKLNGEFGETYGGLSENIENSEQEKPFKTYPPSFVPGTSHTTYNAHRVQNTIDINNTDINNTDNTYNTPPTPPQAGGQSQGKVSHVKKENEEFNSIWKRFVTLIGIKYRNPSEKEKEIIKCWYLDFKLPVELIKLAYDMCIDAKGEYSIRYMNGILGNWFNRGISSVEQARKSSSNSKKQNNKLEATYDIEKYSKYDMFGEI